MAEILGVVSGAAGLISLSGQILHGCLFAKAFFENAKNAPKDIQQILRELEILQASAERTKLLFEEVNGSHTTIDERYFEPPLTECFDTITRIGKKLAEVSLKFEMKKSSRWWEMMKAAAFMNGQLVCLERTKSSLQIVQQNISIALQPRNQISFKEASSSFHSIHAATTETALNVDRVLAQERNIMAVAEQTDQNVAAISKDLREIRSQITSQSSAIIATGQETHKLTASTSTDIHETLSELRNLRSLFELSSGQQAQGSDALKSLLKSAVSEALTEHHSVLRSSEKIDRLHNIPAEDLLSPQLWNTEGRRMQLRSRVLSKSSYNIGLFKSYVETVEERFDIISGKSTAPRPRRRLATTYKIVPNSFFLRREFILDYSSNPKLGILGIQLRTVNFVSDDSPIIRACKALDIDEVQRLFDSRLASPSDYALGGSVFEWAFWYGYFVYEAGGRRERFQRLLQFLIDACGQSWKPVSQYIISYAILRALDDDPYRSSGWADIVRMLLSMTCTDAFEDPTLNGALTFTTSQHSIYDFIRQHDYWDVDLDAQITDSGVFTETDRHIASDVSGFRMKRALLENHSYKVLEDQWDGFENQSAGDYWPLEVERTNALNGLLRLMAGTTRFDVLEGCRNRVLILLQYGYSPDAVEYPRYSWMGSVALFSDVQRRCYNGQILSPTQVAQELGPKYCEIWYNILLEVGIPLEAVTDLLDTELYAGVPELLDQTRPFMTRDECRKEFLENVVTGKFVSQSAEEVYNETNILIFNLGLQRGIFWPGDLRNMVHEANTSFKQKFMPGSWMADCDEEIRLVPGLDFCWPSKKIRFNQEQKWVSWEDVITGVATI